jgi:hypothetical protein
MHATQLLHNVLKKSCPQIHSTRRNCLISSVESLLRGRKLTLTSLGRSSLGNIQVKNKIKRMDRLIGNIHLQEESLDCYRAMAHLLIGSKLHPIIIVDWASVDNRNKFHVLKASLAYEGRAITIFDQVEYKDRPKKETNNSHDQFIENLAKILPPDCRPIIVTDAAFITRWFKRIEKKNWYWVGRLRGIVKMQESGKTNWNTCQKMFTLATNIPKALGEYVLSKKNPLNCQLYIYKEPKKGRKRRNRDGSIKEPSYKQDYKKAGNEPWLLASNLPNSFNLEKKIVKFYKMRMQIEETFRDIKDPRYGFGARMTLSNCKQRVKVLLLIGALALLIFGILGKSAYESGAYRTFQANTIKNRRVLSYWYLGQQVYEHTTSWMPQEMLKKTFLNIINGIRNHEF